MDVEEWFFGLRFIVFRSSDSRYFAERHRRIFDGKNDVCISSARAAVVRSLNVECRQKVSHAVKETSLGDWMRRIPFLVMCDKRE